MMRMHEIHLYELPTESNFLCMVLAVNEYYPSSEKSLNWDIKLGAARLVGYLSLHIQRTLGLQWIL